MFCDLSGGRAAVAMPGLRKQIRFSVQGEEHNSDNLRTIGEMAESDSFLVLVGCKAV